MLHDPRGIWIKVDGVTRPQDCEAAAAAGVSAIGMIFAPSQRRVTIDEARELREAIPHGVLAFGVFDGLSEQDVLDAVIALRLQGAQSPAHMSPIDGVLILRTVRVQTAQDLAVPASGVLHIDAYVPGQLGGTGVVAPWDLIEANRPNAEFVLSGGLRPDNVAEAIRRLRPAGVDVSSGVESSPGVKDHAKLHDFVTQARSI